MPTFPRIKQQQIFPGVNRSRAQAVKVTTSEAIAAGDIIVGTGFSSGVMTVHKADANDAAKCQGPFFIADYGAASGVTTDLAIPWKIVTGVNTATFTVGSPVWLSTTAGGYVVGTLPLLTTNGLQAVFAIKIGRVLATHASTGVIMLEPGMATGAPLVGRVTLGGGSSTTVTGLPAGLAGAPCIVTPDGATADHATQVTATIAGTTLTLAHDTSSDDVSYAIYG
jgi:hypothetical protein